jgi:hypothetical protein
MLKRAPYAFATTVAALMDDSQGYREVRSLTLKYSFQAALLRYVEMAYSVYLSDLTEAYAARR